MAELDSRTQRKIKQYRDKGLQAMASKEFMVAKQYFEGLLELDPEDQNLSEKISA